MFSLQTTPLVIDATGLMLRACPLAKREGDRLQAHEAALAILAKPAQAGTIRKAIEAWNAGDQAHALMLLVQLGDPEVKTEAQVLAELAKAGFDANQPRDEDGKWTDEGGADDSASGTEITIRPDTPANGNPSIGASIGHGFAEALGIPAAEAQEIPEEEPREELTSGEEDRLGPGEEPSLSQQLRLDDFNKATKILRTIDSSNPALQSMTAPGYVPTQANIDSLREAARKALGVPEDWLSTVTNKKDGWEYINPVNDNDRVRLMAGNPTGSLPARRQPYAMDQISGLYLRTDGTRQLGGSAPDAHYPLGDYKFRRD